MRPLSLRMQAFGPYADSEVINFEKLENRTMFVISGKTGSGKTSIFDGICFAIYGRASGEDRTGMDLRSHFAPDDIETEVSLTFSLKGKTYFIKRTPQQIRKKTRGDGYTTVSATAELYIVDESGTKQLIASNVRETDEKIKEIIQLDANQFRQILMIPQGDFRKLLTSDSKEKEVILQRLFHTELYKQIEEKLRERAGLLKKEVEAGIDRRDQVLRGIYTNNNEDLEAALSEKVLNDTMILQMLAQVQQELEEMEKTYMKQIKQQQAERDEAKSRVDAAEGLLKEFELKAKLEAQKKQLGEQKQLIEAYQKEIDLAERANKLENQEELCRRMKKELDGINEEYEKQQSLVQKTKKDLAIAKEQLLQEEGKKEDKEKLRETLFRLENSREDVYLYAERKSAYEKTKKELAQCRSAIEKDQHMLQELVQKVAEREKQLKELEKMRIEKMTIESEEKRLTELSKNLKQLLERMEQGKRYEDRLQQLDQQLQSARQYEQDARETVYYIEAQWFSGQAAALASNLASGHPCPVCGSTEHPAPIEGSDHIPREEDVRAAKSDLAEKEKDRIKIEQDRHRIIVESNVLNQAVDELTKTIAVHHPGFSLLNVEADLQSTVQLHKEVVHKLETYEEKISSIPMLEENVKKLESKQAETQTRLDQLLKDERTLVDTYSQSSALIQSLTRTLPEDLRDRDQFDRKAAKVKSELEEMEQALESARENYTKVNNDLAKLTGTLANLEKAAERAEKSLQTERETFLNQLAREDFSSYRVYAESKRTPEQIDRLKKMIKDYGEELRSVTDRLNDYEVRLKNMEKPDIEKLRELFNEQNRLLSSLNEQHSRLSNHKRNNLTIIQMVQSINDQIKHAEESYKMIGHLSDITRGQNTYRLTFERYVLASFLDNILAAANARLVRMTSGRYKLLRKTDRSKGNVQSGLELLVFDQYTGQNRHVKTLSGGESFKAALSLALGLADVVQENAGGVSLETMFIDEGFGTLDPESLDHAIEALMEIQDSGRLVGIISHVPELKERIDARLEVISGQSGSTTEFVFS